VAEGKLTYRRQVGLSSVNVAAKFGIKCNCNSRTFELLLPASHSSLTSRSAVMVPKL